MHAMALRELPFRAASSALRPGNARALALAPSLCRNASTAALSEVEDSSSLAAPPPSEDVAKTFDPLARSRLRRQGKKELPASRYVAPATHTRSLA